MKTFSLRIYCFFIKLLWTVSKLSIQQKVDLNLPPSIFTRTLQYNNEHSNFLFRLILGTSYVPLQSKSFLEGVRLPLGSDDKQRYNVFTEIGILPNDVLTGYAIEISCTGVPGSAFTLIAKRPCGESKNDKTDLVRVRWLALQEGTYFNPDNTDTGCLSSGRVQLKKDTYTSTVNLNFPNGCIFNTTLGNSLIIVQPQQPTSTTSAVSLAVSGYINSAGQLEIKATELADANLPESLEVAYIILSQDTNFRDIHSNLIMTGITASSSGALLTHELPGSSFCDVPIVLSNPTVIAPKTTLVPFVSKDKTLSLSNIKANMIYISGRKVACPDSSISMEFKNQVFIILFQGIGCTLYNADDLVYHQQAPDSLLVLFNTSSNAIIWIILLAVALSLVVGISLYCCVRKRTRNHKSHSATELVEHPFVPPQQNDSSSLPQHHRHYNY